MGRRQGVWPGFRKKTDPLSPRLNAQDSSGSEKARPRIPPPPFPQTPKAASKAVKAALPARHRTLPLRRHEARRARSPAPRQNLGTPQATSTTKTRPTGAPRRPRRAGRAARQGDHRRESSLKAQDETARSSARVSDGSYNPLKRLTPPSDPSGKPPQPPPRHTQSRRPRCHASTPPTCQHRARASEPQHQPRPRRSRKCLSNSVEGDPREPQQNSPHRALQQEVQEFVYAVMYHELEQEQLQWWQDTLKERCRYHRFPCRAWFELVYQWHPVTATMQPGNRQMNPRPDGQHTPAAGISGTPSSQAHPAPTCSIPCYIPVLLNYEQSASSTQAPSVRLHRV